MTDMSNNDKKATKKLVSEAIRKREGMKSARNPHVAELTIGRSAWVRGEQVKLNNDQRHEMEFHLRRMWAITLLDNMQEHGFSWEGIRKLTGKTRQTWSNVTSSGFVPLDILNMPTDNNRRAKLSKTNGTGPSPTGSSAPSLKASNSTNTPCCASFARMFTRTHAEQRFVVGPQDEYIANDWATMGAMRWSQCVSTLGHRLRRTMEIYRP